MAYDVFDTYRKRLTESTSSRFKDVGVQTPQRVEKMSEEEMFDNAFRNVYGIVESRLTETIIRCPKCDSIMDWDEDGELYCPSCGARESDIPHCPECNALMEKEWDEWCCPQCDCVLQEWELAQDDDDGEYAQDTTSNDRDQEDFIHYEGGKYAKDLKRNAGYIVYSRTGKYIGFADSPEEAKMMIRSCRESLNEDFGTFPDWLKKFFADRKDVKERLTKRGVDLSRATFISGQLPRNARDPAFRDPTRVAVFRMVDRVGGNYEVIYIPGVTDPDVYPDDNNRWSRYSASSISKKKLLELTKEYGYIDMNDSRNSNRELRKERSDAKSGMVVRNRAAGLSPQKTNVQYATDERGRTNWDEVISYDIKWVTKRGFDKSGYPLDPDKYGRMLDNVGLEDYATRLEMLYNKIESARERLIAVMSKYTVKDSTKVKVRNTWGRNIFGDVARIAQDFSNAIDAYQELQDSVQQIIDATGLEDTEKNERIAYVFKWNGKRVREYLKDVTSALKSAETAEQL